MSAILFHGTILTMDNDYAGPDVAPEAVLVEGERITGVGSLDELRRRAPKDVDEVVLGDRVLMPGLIEPHSHPTVTAILLGSSVVDIRPVVIDTAEGVWNAIKNAIDQKPDRVFANGWDPLLQTGLEQPTQASLDEVAGETPLVILHNSGHTAYFNSAAARVAGIDDSTKDPPGASFSRDGSGRLTGHANEAAAVGKVIGPALADAQKDFPQLFADYVRQVNKRGVTTMGELAFDPSSQPGLDAVRKSGDLTLRLRLYETSRPGASASVPRDNGDDLVTQIGIKIWADGSPWTGNIATSFPYLNTPATKTMGLEKDHHGEANYSGDELVDLIRQYAGDGWQLSCHVHGDRAIDEVLDVYEQMIGEFDLHDHRFRLEHVGAMTPEQFERAARLGVTASIFVDHVYYWGDVLVDDLFGDEHGSRWTDAASAFAAGVHPSFHNDGFVTPLEPFRNMATAITRLSKSGRHLDGADGVTIDEALAAHTTNAAYQLFAGDIIGSITPGKYADLVIVDRDPRAIGPETLPEVVVERTYLAGQLVFDRATTAATANASTLSVGTENRR